MYYKPIAVMKDNQYKLYYDRSILTDQTIHHNRPDKVLQDKTNKETYIIDVTTPNTHNLSNAIQEKIRKYTDLMQEVARVWDMNKVYIVPLVISTTGVIPTILHHNLKLLNLNSTLFIKMQKAVILNICRIVRKFLDE